MKHRTLPQKCALDRAGKLRAGLAGLLLFPLMFLVAGVCRADDGANDAVQELARKVAAQVNPRLKVDFEFRNPVGVLSEAEFSAARSAFDAEIRKRGFHNTLDGANISDVVVVVTLSETPQMRLWIAEFQKGGSVTPLFVAFAKQALTTQKRSSGIIRIQPKPIFESGDSILDFAIVKSQGDQASEILILGTGGLSLYDRNQGQWRLTKTLPIAHSFPTPRDPRGRIVFRSDEDEFTAGVPGSSCHGNMHSGFTLECEATLKGWGFALAGDSFQTMVLSPRRNSFQVSESRRHPAPAQSEAAIQEEKEFYSEAHWPTGGDWEMIQTRLDGHAWLIKQESQPIMLSVDWGSDLVATKNACGSDAVILSTGPRDYTSFDYVQAFGISGVDANPIGSRTEFSGPITSFWESLNGDTARVVVHNLKSGNYEAYEITLTCDR